MNRFFIYSLLVTILSFATVGCKKDNNNDKSLSPPEWILGEWKWEMDDGMGGIYSIYFKFTSNDIINTVVVSQNSVTLIFSEIDNQLSIKETLKKDYIYEVTISYPNGMGEPSVHSFKKGDGTFIEHALNSNVYTNLTKCSI